MSIGDEGAFMNPGEFATAKLLWTGDVDPFKLKLFIGIGDTLIAGCDGKYKVSKYELLLLWMLFIDVIETFDNRRWTLKEVNESVNWKNKFLQVFYQLNRLNVTSQIRI